MPQTLAQKIIARAAGRDAVTPGEIVTCKVDLAMFHDSSGPRRLQPMLERLGAKVWDAERIVLISISTPMTASPPNAVTVSAKVNRSDTGGLPPAKRER